jgi:thiol-disulfide isomerase/thioredoxin
MKYYFKGLFIVLLFFGIHFDSSAQGYRIQATIKGYADSTFVIGHYNRSHTQFVPKDTATANAEGQVVFKKNTELPGGLYVILFPGNSRLIEFIYSGEEKQFSFATDTLDLIDHMKVSGSMENQIFYQYQQELRKIEKQMAAQKQESSAESESKINALREQYLTFRKKFFLDNKSTFTVKLLNLVADPEIPTPPKDNRDSLWSYHYYKAHFWDAFDFADPRILKTPFFDKKVEQYFTSVVQQVPDSLIKEADLVIKKAGANPDAKSAVVYQIANLYENPKIVGAESVWVHIAEKYYLSGEMGTAEESKARIASKVNTLKKLLVGKILPNLQLSDPTGKNFSVNTIPAEYMVVFFYSPTCGHCKEAAPQLKEFFEKHKAENVKVVAVATERNVEEWKKFISTQHLEAVIHGSDATNSIDFNRGFDVVSTPMIYILDKNKKIIARKMPVNQLDDFLNFYKKRMQVKK